MDKQSTDPTGAITTASSFPPLTDYEVRSQALGFALNTYTDNRNIDADVIIKAATAYEKFLKEVQSS